MPKFTINTKKLQQLTNKVAKGASNSKFSAITSLINVSLKDGTLSMTTTDTISYLTLREYDVSGDDMTFTVGVDIFSKLVSKTSAENVTISLADDVVNFTGNGTYKIPIQLDVDGNQIKYPVHIIDNPETQGNIKNSVIKNIILHNKPSLALTMEAPYLTGYLCTEDNVVSADTFNICINNVSTFGKNVLVSPNVFELLSMCNEEDIGFKILADTVIFETATMKLYSRFMSGCDEYPLEPIMQYSDREYPSACVVQKTAICNVVDRLSIFIKDNEKNALYMTFTEDGIKFESMNSVGFENVPYQNSEGYKPFTCCIGVDFLKKQMLARSDENVHLYYGDDSTVAIKDDGVMQFVALMDDPRIQE